MSGSYVDCPARAALAGNPSDAYDGAVLAVPVTQFAATVSSSPAEHYGVDHDDPDMIRLIDATVARLIRELGCPVPTVELKPSTTIPRSVGLAGSSALVIATLRSLAPRVGWTPTSLELAELALSIEHDDMGITAGLQDRLVQAHERPILMDFSADTTVTPVAFHPSIRLFMAWSDRAAASSDLTHRPLLERHRNGERAVRAAMGRLRTLAHDATTAAIAGDVEALGTTMNTTFEIRAELTDVPGPMLQLVEQARRRGAPVNSAGSGGSIVGLFSDDAHAVEIAEALVQIGAELSEINLGEPEVSP